jgi:hypothetical protein
MAKKAWTKGVVELDLQGPFQEMVDYADSPNKPIGEISCMHPPLDGHVPNMATIITDKNIVSWNNNALIQLPATSD